MKSRYEVKNDFKEKNYSVKELKQGIFLFKIAGFLFSEFFIFIISTIPFIIGYIILAYLFGNSSTVALFYLLMHLIFYSFYVRKIYKKELLEHYNESQLIIDVLRELISEKSN